MVTPDGSGFGVRGWGKPIPLDEQGLAWAEWDAAEIAADAAFAAANPTCTCFDPRTGEWDDTYCTTHRKETA